MNRTLLSAVIVTFAMSLGLLAQAPQRDMAASTAPPTGTARIFGVITERENVPLRRAKVTVAGDMRLTRTVLTDNEGRFSVETLPTGRFTVTAEKAGYPPMSFGARQAYRTGAGVFLAEGATVETSFMVPRGAVMSGTVYDERGAPMPDVPVMAWLVRTSLGGQRTLDFPGGEPVTVTTDERGRYRVFGLAAGEYVMGTSWSFHGIGSDVRLPSVADFEMAFRRPGQPAPTPEPESPARFNYSQIFAPSSTDPLAAQSLQLSPGQEVEGVDIHMQFVQMARMEGTLVHPEGVSLSARLFLQRTSAVAALNTGREWPSQRTGRFVSGSLNAGPYSLFAEVAAADGQPAMWAAQDVVLAPGEVANVTMTLQPSLSMGGSVMFVGKSDQPPDVARTIVSLRRQGPLWARPVSKVDSTGTFSVTGVIPGPYVIAASVPAGNAAAGAAWRLASVMIGDQDVTDRPVEIGPGTGPITITFTDVVTELSGRLLSATGEPTADYFVIALPENRELWVPQSRRIVSTRPDGAGRYVFRGLPPGKYRIAVTTDLVPRDLQEHDVLEQLLPQSLPVTVTFDEPRTLDIRTTGG
jgi:hypothetical protein